MIVNKPKIVFEALMLGLTVPLGEYRLKLFKPGEPVCLPSIPDGEAIDYWLGIELVSPKGQYVGTSLDIVQLIALAEKMTDDQVMGLIANLALNKKD